MSDDQEIAAITEWLGPVDMEAVLAQVTDTEQTQRVESVSAAAVAYYREQHEYESLIDAWRIYVLARRRTTELYLQEWQGNNSVTLEQIGFTKMQWHRRVKEYEIEMEKLNAYFDECVANGWNPSIAGLLRDSSGGSGGGLRAKLYELIEKWNKGYGNEEQDIAMARCADELAAVLKVKS